MPAFEPPFDDEVSPQVWATAHQLAFDWSALTTPHEGDPQRSHTGPRRETGQASTGQPSTGQPSAGQAIARHVTGTGTGEHPGCAVVGASVEAKLAVRRFVAVCVEVLNGYRPAAHLRRLSMPGEAAGVVAQALAGARRVGEMRRAGGRAVRTTSRHGRHPDPVAVRKLRLCEPRPGAVEAAVLLITGDRTWAVALRLEHHQQSWAATALRLI